jgi:hypothetical protein
MLTIERNIGRNRGKPRLWIEGQSLIEAGLPHGARWNLEAREGGFDIVRAEGGKRKIAGTPARPIIDMAGASLGHLGSVARVAISYDLGAGRMAVRDADRRNAA